MYNMYNKQNANATAAILFLHCRDNFDVGIIHTESETQTTITTIR